MRYDSGMNLAVFEFQTPSTLDQAGPVQNTYYPILDIDELARVYRIGVNIEDADEDLQVRITVDGQVIDGDQITATHSTKYHCYLYANAIGKVIKNTINTSVAYSSYMAFLLEGHEIKVEVRKTTANGAGKLTGIVAYGVLKGLA